MIVLKSIYVQKNKPNSTTTTTTNNKQQTNKQTKKGLILTTSGQGRLDEMFSNSFTNNSFSSFSVKDGWMAKRRKITIITP